MQTDNSLKLLKKAKNSYKFSIILVFLVMAQLLWVIFGSKLIEDTPFRLRITFINEIILLILFVIRLVGSFIALKNAKKIYKEST